MIEISESEYLIKLKKGEFDLAQLRAVLNQILNLPKWEDAAEAGSFMTMRSAELMERFDYLDDK